MKTLAYFASGSSVKREYSNLPFDKIYLINNGFGGTIINRGKIVCVDMDCLESIDYLKSQNVKIDCFVSLNEGLYEGGGSYGINSDKFLGYAMPLLNNVYYHIMCKEYYRSRRMNVSMDLPFEKNEISKRDENYIDPFIFTNHSVQINNPKVFRMVKARTEIILPLESDVKVTIIHDSIWCDYDKLDCLFSSFSKGITGKFFRDIPKVVEINKSNFYMNLEHCVENKLSVVGFTPWKHGQYRAILEELKNYKKEYPKEIRFYHLNKNDYEEIKNIQEIKKVKQII